jgi:hypothetical protein
MLLIKGKRFEIEFNGLSSLFIRLGDEGAPWFERFYNRDGLPDGTWKSPY